MIFKQTLAILILLSSFTYSQIKQWVDFVAQSSITCQAIEGNYLWIGTEGYLTKLNIFTGEKEVFTTNNSGLPDNHIKTIAIDNKGNKWIGTNIGLKVINEKEVVLTGVKNDNYLLEQN